MASSPATLPEVGCVRRCAIEIGFPRTAATSRFGAEARCVGAFSAGRCAVVGELAGEVAQPFVTRIKLTNTRSHRYMRASFAATTLVESASPSESPAVALQYLGTPHRA